MYKFLVILLILIIIYFLFSCEEKPKPTKQIIINEQPIVKQEYINYTTPRVEPETINYTTTKIPIITTQKPIKENNVVEQILPPNSRAQSIFYYEPINYN